MLFQYGGAFTNVFYDLQQWGIFDILIPFILIFTILYAILSKINVFGEKQKKMIICNAKKIQKKKSTGHMFLCI